MQNRCKKKACKKCGKWWQKGAKMGAEIHQKSKKWWKKRMPKNNVEIWGQTNPSLRDFAGGLGSIFGGAGEGGKLKPASTSWLIIVWHARHPSGVRRIKNWCENGAKIHPNRWKIHRKIDVGKRTDQNQKKSTPGALKGRKCRNGLSMGLAFLARWGPYIEGIEGIDYSRSAVKIRILIVSQVLERNILL